MGQYKVSRCLEASFIDFLTNNFSVDWSNVTVIKGFRRAYDYNVTLPIISVRLNDTNYTNIQIGSKQSVRETIIYLDIFATSDGQRLDLKDYIIEKLHSDIAYYNYIITKGAISSKIQDGYIQILNVEDTPIDFNINKDELHRNDRYRHSIVLTVTTGSIE